MYTNSRSSPSFQNVVLIAKALEVDISRFAECHFDANYKKKKRKTKADDEKTGPS